MSEQITALLAKLKEDADLREKLAGASDLDAAAALVQEAGFDVTKADWLSYQQGLSLELSDEELETVAGGSKAGAKSFGNALLGNEALATYAYGRMAAR